MFICFLPLVMQRVLKAGLRMRRSLVHISEMTVIPFSARYACVGNEIAMLPQIYQRSISVDLVSHETTTRHKSRLVTSIATNFVWLIERKILGCTVLYKNECNF